MGSPDAPFGAPASRQAGRLVVVAMVALGIGAAVTGIAFQRSQTRRCLSFLGREAARRISESPHVELLRVAATAQAGRLVVVDRRDISAARGLVHLRRGLVEDANYDWPRDGGTQRLPASSWDWAIVFADSATAATRGDATVLVFDLGARDGSEPRNGWMAVVGAPGRVGLGRINRGLATWIEGL